MELTFFMVWLITIIVFLLGDVAWLFFVMNRFFIHHIKHLMTITNQEVSINYISALVAYVLIVAALTWFVLLPQSQAPIRYIFLQSAFLGLSIYGVYELTNHAILAQWPITFVIVDVVWGTLWCGAAGVISILIARAFSYFVP